MTESLRSVTATVPATTANLGPGFDCLGLALELRNEFRLTGAGWVSRPEQVRLSVEVTGEGSRTLSQGEDNLACRAALAAFARAGRYPASLNLSLRNAIPLGKGLGSSASAIVGGVWAAAAFLEEPLDDAHWLGLAAQLEGHPDNVVPAAVGGLTVAVAGGAGAPPSFVRFEVGGELLAVVAVPSFSLRTSESRRRLPKQVPFPDAVFNLSRSAALVANAARGDWQGAALAMEDRLHQPYRAPLIPGFAKVCTSAREAGAAAAVLSGAGPSVMALVLGAGDEALSRAEAVGTAMEQAFRSAGVNAEALILRPASAGVRVTSETQG